MAKLAACWSLLGCVSAPGRRVPSLRCDAGEGRPRRGCELQSARDWMSHADFYSGLPGDPISAHIDGECSPEDPLPAGMDGQVRFEAAMWLRRTFSGGASGGERRTRL
ncbi:unnamed protein product [Miscanthus lutarioriparius]|uniref:Uncharacterized protein n=1 Tax=Miscanthus lutarioriparius TaxID=422564 RepID=A0A811P5R3_9POAL|nr:unnamed protein product [Miscanthus lutarioriparius]